jgi:uncharacterized RDD family membrane protein YckC
MTTRWSTPFTLIRKNMETPHAVNFVKTETAVYAGFWLRLVAVKFDAAAMFFPLVFLSFVVVFLIRLVSAWTGYHPGVMFLTSLPIIIIVGTWLYFALMESSPWQATLGKKIFGLYVTDLNGQRLTLSRATGRTLAKYLSTMTAGIGYLLCGFTSRKQALHDMVAKCLVLRRSGPQRFD